MQPTLPVQEICTVDINKPLFPTLNSANSATGACIYGRVSTNVQETAQQEVRAKEYLTFKRVPIAAEFYDDDVSGSVAIWDRPKGRALRRFLDANPGINHLVVVKLDRLGRSAIDLLKTVEFLDSRKVVLHIVDLGGDALSTQGASGRLMFTVLAGMAQYEKELIKSRINDRFQVKRAKGELCGTEPYGWVAVETGEVTNKGVKVRRLSPHTEEQRWIAEMQALRAQGLSYGKIAVLLNQWGVPTKRGPGQIITYRGKQRFASGKWQAGNVAKVINSKNVQHLLSAQAQAADVAA